MISHSLYEIGAFFTTALDMSHMGLVMNRDRLGVIERMEEVMAMCHREHPIYEQISSFSVALYAIGFSDRVFDSPDLLSFQDVDEQAAARIITDHFTEVAEDHIPLNYHITQSEDIYLLVVGDPLYPLHFAVLANQKSGKPYFSKLPFFGAGFDSLNELNQEFFRTDGLSASDFHFYKKNEG